MASHIQLQESLKRPYDRLLFAKDVLSQIFHDGLKLLQLPIAAPVQPSASEKKIIERVSIYGSIILEDQTEVTCYEILLKSNVKLEQSKVAIQHYVRKLLTSGQAALVNFVSTDNKNLWRLTLVAKDSELTLQGVKEKSTNSKRYTFLLGPDESCKTAAERFEALSIETAIDLKAVMKAFSVEKLSRNFFDEYKFHFERFVKYLIESNFRTSVFNGDEKAIRDFVKKLLARLVFLSFVQKKGWLGASNTEYKDGDSNFLMNLFLSSGGNEAFYEKWLKVLFFDTLNNHKGRPHDDFLLPDTTKVKIPFLNGGLFDKEPIDDKILSLPPTLFHNHDNKDDPKLRGFLDFLEAFNFTVHEDSPDDHTVAVDPEMLGHIFENLLEDNKDRGTFYTPKEIVHYMCQESLMEYIATESGLEKEVLENVVRYKEVENYDRTLLGRINDILDKVKICDPAIGSGAFPMGLLLEIFSIKEAIAYACNFSWNPATVKQHIIQESIYGVDIEKGAVDIARLRFWLSLVVDEELPRPLPNLDYKIMQGNSLLESYEDLDLCVKIEEDTTLFRDEKKFSGKDIERLNKLVSKYFTIDNSDSKKTLQHSIDEIVDKFISTQVHGKIKRNNEILDDVQLKLATVNKQQPKTNADKKKKEEGLRKLNSVLEKTLKEAARLKGIEKQLSEIRKTRTYPYFLWHLWFSEIFTHGGFDIVIGNPPYIQLQKDGGELADLYEKSNYSTFDRMGDIYSLFYEKGWQLLKPKGNLCFITSNKWMRAGYGESTRAFLSENTDPILLVDFPEQKIFDSATVVTNILLFSKAKNQGKTFACSVTKKVLNNLSVFVRQNGFVGEFLNSACWSILSPIERRIKDKIEQIGTPLKQWNITINYGIKTGLNEAFIISGERRNELIKEDPKSAEIIRPIIRGRDIKRYNYQFADQWLIFVPWHFPLHQDATIKGVSEAAELAFKASYPAIYNHLLGFKKELSNRNKAETGIRYEWYALQRWGADYWDDFSKQKIIWIELTDHPNFCLDSEGFYLNNTVFFIVGDRLPYILSFLNSRLCEWYFGKIAATSGVGTRRWIKQYIEQICIPEVIPERVEKSLHELTTKIQIRRKNGKDVKDLEDQIDDLIFSLFNLSADEIECVHHSDLVSTG